MELEFGAQGAGALADAGDFVAQVGFVEHLLHVTQAVGPLGELGAGDGSELLRATAASAGVAATFVRPACGGVEETLLAGLALTVGILLTAGAGSAGLPGILLRLLGLLLLAGLRL